MKADKELLERMVELTEDASDIILRLWHNHEAQAEAISTGQEPQNLQAVESEVVLGLLAEMRVLQYACRSDLEDIAHEEAHP